MAYNNYMWRGHALRIAFGITMLALMLAGVSSAATFTVNASGGADYTKIQDAIDNATSGDTIEVHAGSYFENVNITRKITLRGIGMPVVDAGGNGNVITLSENGIRLEGFTATESAGYRIQQLPGAGILVTSNNNTLTGNNASNNGIGIYMSGSNNTLIGNSASNNYYGKYSNDAGDGIRLVSSNNTLIDNIASNNGEYGIYLSGSNNTLIGNNASNNGDYGIILSFSTKNVLKNNVMKGNNFNFELDGNSDSYFDNQIDATNLVDGKPVYYIKGVRDTVYDSSTNAGTFYCINCWNVTIKDLNLNKNYYGVFFWNTNFSKIQNVKVYKNYDGIGMEFCNNTWLMDNEASDNEYGIYLQDSNNNTIIGNYAANNHWDGIILFPSSNNNTLSGNNALNNSWNGISLSSNSNNNMLIGNIASNNRNNGIELDSSSNNTLSDNNALYNYYGIHIMYSSNNTVIGNIAANNYPHGIYLYSSSNNLIYNNIFSNTNNVRFIDSINNWNITKQSGTNILGSSYLGGNFWAKPDGTGFSQTCSDANMDGICDSPYVLDVNNTDYLPLAITSTMIPSISFTDPTPANGATITQDYAIINTSVSNALTAFIDWNRSLVGWWRFNNESGESPSFFRDWSSWGNNATCSGANCPLLTSGMFGSAMGFDGSDDYADVPNSASLNPSNITLEAWFNANPGSLARQKPLIQKPFTNHTAPYYQYMLSLADTATSPRSADFYLAVNGVWRYVEIKNLSYNYGQWHYLAGTYDGSNMTMYLDGVAVGTAPVAGTITSYDTIIEIGAYPNMPKDPDNIFKGKIDELRIHSRALSPDEIKASYDAEINSLNRNFTNLINGVYYYRAYAQNQEGTVNQTEERILTVSV
jgi:parallel beta-helix repeat protein